MKPRALRPGDTISLVSPSSVFLPEKLEGMQKILEDAGYRIKLGEHVYAQHHYLAGTDEQRASDLQAAFDDPDTQAVLCSRGGYGCARLMPHLEFDRMAVPGKMFLGFSDITTVHLALNRRGLPTVHGPMALSFSVEREPWVYESFLNVLKGENPIPKDTPRAETIVGGTAEGEVTGGCLCLVTDSVATADSFEANGKIVLIEDVDEHPHRIDAMLTHLLNTGLIQGAAGIVIGEMTRTDEMEDASIGRRPWRDIVLERLEPLGIPMVFGFPFGHQKNMLSLPLGIRAGLDADAGTLTYLEPLCS